MSARLTTHVLDIAQGRPAAGIVVELWSIAPQSGERTLLGAARTNNIGRTGTPLLAERDLEVGVYELVFLVGEYFAGQPVETASPPFLDRVPVRFGIADADAHY